MYREVAAAEKADQAYTGERTQECPHMLSEIDKGFFINNHPRNTQLSFYFFSHEAAFQLRLSADRQAQHDIVLCCLYSYPTNLLRQQ